MLAHKRLPEACDRPRSTWETQCASKLEVAHTPGLNHVTLHRDDRNRGAVPRAQSLAAVDIDDLHRETIVGGGRGNDRMGTLAQMAVVACVQDDRVVSQCGAFPEPSED